MPLQTDMDILRNLASRYADIAALPLQDEKRRLWTDHMSRKPTRVPVLASFGMHNVWCRDLFGDARMECTDTFYRDIERCLKMMIFRHEVVGDDAIQEPWFSLGATLKGCENGLWGVSEAMKSPGVEGGAAAFDPPLKHWDDVERLRMIHHAIDEDATCANMEKLSRALADILPIDLYRAPAYLGFGGDISTSLARLRGLNQLMIDMYESPDELHRLLAFMRDSILTNNLEAEEAGDFTLTAGQNQAMCYADELEPPRPNSAPCRRRDLWGFCAAQEYTLISPDFHERFLFRYQAPICRHFGLLHYGCCEDLGRKIDMLRTLPNLRSIAVTPVADVRRCAEQIGSDYVMSWRPNPTDMVCCGFHEKLIRRIVGEALEAFRDGYAHVHLKDIETVEGDVTRLTRWVELVRRIAGDA